MTIKVNRKDVEELWDMIRVYETTTDAEIKMDLYSDIVCQSSYMARDNEAIKTKALFINLYELLGNFDKCNEEEYYKLMDFLGIEIVG